MKSIHELNALIENLHDEDAVRYMHEQTAQNLIESKTLVLALEGIHTDTGRLLLSCIASKEQLLAELKGRVDFTNSSMLVAYTTVLVKTIKDYTG